MSDKKITQLINTHSGDKAGYWLEVDSTSNGTKRIPYSKIQTVDGLASPVGGYKFDGVDDYGSIADNPNLDFLPSGDTTSKGSFYFYTKMLTNNNGIVEKGLGLNNAYKVEVQTNTFYFFLFTDGSNLLRVSFDITPYLNKEVLFILNYNGNKTFDIYANNAPISSSVTEVGTFTGLTNNSADLYIGRTSSRYLDGNLWLFGMFNIIADSTLRDILWNDGEPEKVVIPYEYSGASNDNYKNTPTLTGTAVDNGGGSYTMTGNSGTNSVVFESIWSANGKDNKMIEISYEIVSSDIDGQFRVTGWTGNELFAGSIDSVNMADLPTSVGVHTFRGIPNRGGNQNYHAFWLYTDNTSGSITFKNISIKQVGEVLNLKPLNAGANGWVGELGGKPVVMNMYGNPMAYGSDKDGYFGAPDGATGTTSFEFKDSVPANKTLRKAIIYNNEASVRYINLGTTAGGTDIANNVAVTASDYTLISLDKYFSPNEKQSIYLSPGSSNPSSQWVGTEDLDIRFYMKD